MIVLVDGRVVSNQPRWGTVCSERLTIWPAAAAACGRLSTTTRLMCSDWTAMGAASSSPAYQLSRS
jgi:hypothetical protein